MMLQLSEKSQILLIQAYRSRVGLEICTVKVEMAKTAITRTIMTKITIQKT
jgi:hypothetical protein